MVVTALFRRALIPAYESRLMLRPALRYWRGLEASQWRPPERLDVLTTPNGRRVPGEAFVRPLKNVRGLRRFQVAQESATHVTLRLLLGSEPSDDAFTPFLALLGGLVGSAVRLRIERVSDALPNRPIKLSALVNRTFAGSDRSDTLLRMVACVSCF